MRKVYLVLMGEIHGYFKRLCHNKWLIFDEK